MPDLEYNRRMEELEKERYTAYTGRSVDRMTPEEKMANATVDVSVMSALFDSEYWKMDVWPRIKDYYGVASDPEFWKEDVRRNIKPALKKTAKSATAGVLGAPMDLTVLAAHTFWWVTDNIGLSNRGHYDWLDDMPDFSQFPTTSDSIMKNLFDEEPAGIEWLAGNLLSPPSSFIAKASVFLGPMVGFPRYVASLGDDAVQVRNAYKNYEDARFYRDRVLAGEMTNSEMIAETGWAVSPNGEMQMFLDSSDASFNWDVIDQSLVAAADSAKGATRVKAQFRTGDAWDHPQLREVYGDEYGDFTTEFSLERIPKGQNIAGLGGYKIQDSSGNWWQVSEDKGNAYGAAMDTHTQWEKGTARIKGANARDYPGQKIKSNDYMRGLLEEYMVHEYRHAFSALEGFVGGGSTSWYENILTTRIKDYLQHQVPLIVAKLSESGKVDVVGNAKFFEAMQKAFPNVNDDVLRGYIRKGAELVENRPLREGYMSNRDVAIDEVGKIVNMTAGTKVSKQAVDTFARRMDTVIIEDLAHNIYGRLGDEQAARMQEYLWTMRESDPEKRMELARKYALETSWTFRDLPPFIERLFGPGYDPTAPVKGLTQKWDYELRKFVLDPEGKKWETFMRGAPERAAADKADELNVTLADDVVELGEFRATQMAEPSQPPEWVDTLRKDKRLKDIEIERQFNGDPSIEPGTAKHNKILKGLHSEEELLDDLEGGLDIDRADAEALVESVLKERQQ